MAMEGIRVRRQDHDEDEYDRLEQYERLADLFDEEADSEEDEDEDEDEAEDYGEEDE